MTLLHALFLELVELVLQEGIICNYISYVIIQGINSSVVDITMLHLFVLPMTLPLTLNACGEPLTLDMAGDPLPLEGLENDAIPGFLKYQNKFSLTFILCLAFNLF